MPTSLAAAGRTGRSLVSTRVALAQLRQQRFGTAAMQIPEHAVVVEDGHFVLRKQHGEEIIVRAFAAARLRDARGGG